MSLSQRPQLGLSQNLKLSQIISRVNLSSIPISTLDDVMASIVENPSEAERIIKSSKTLAVDYLTNAVWGELEPNSSGQSGGGLNVPSSLWSFNSLVGDFDAEIQPDVVYSGREGMKPLICFASNLEPNLKLSQIQIPDSFPNAQKLYFSLVRSKNWTVSNLRNVYTFLGNSQREFISTLDPLRLNICDKNEVASELDLHPSSVFRLMRDKYVEVNSSDGESEIHPVDHLTATRDDLKRYSAVSKINPLLARENVDGAFSDKCLSNLTGVPRRTVTKYRGHLTGIPDMYARETAYAADPLKEFKIPYFSD